jgi:hypothetical protein
VMNEQTSVGQGDVSLNEDTVAFCLTVSGVSCYCGTTAKWMTGKSIAHRLIKFKFRKRDVAFSM